MNLAGIFAPIPTPFDDRDRVDTARLKAALARWLKRPLTGFVVLGSNGEAALMDDYESDQAIVAARESIPHDRGFIVGTGRESHLRNECPESVAQLADVGDGVSLLKKMGAEIPRSRMRITGNGAPEFVLPQLRMRTDRCGSEGQIGYERRRIDVLGIEQHGGVGVWVLV